MRHGNTRHNPTIPKLLSLQPSTCAGACPTPSFGRCSSRLAVRALKVVGGDGELIGQIHVQHGQEPADAVYAFCRKVRSGARVTSERRETERNLSQR